MSTTVKVENRSTRISDHTGDYIFIDPQENHNVVNLVARGVPMLDREGVIALQEALSAALADFDERNRVVPLSEQARALEPGTKFEFNSGRDFLEPGVWFRTEKGAISLAGVESTDFAFFDQWADEYDGAIVVVG